jgi:PAS domain S-box-containing protein
MDIRTKLVFTLVVVALVSMFVLSLAMYAIAEPALRDSRLDLLEALAESKRDDMEQVFAGWVDRVRLVASRTQLRISLREHDRTGSTEPVDRIHRILTDAVDAVDVIEALAVFDTEHHLVTSAGREMDLASREDLPQMTSVAEGIGYRGISPTGDGDLRVGFVARLSLEGEPVGDLHVRLNAQPLLDLAEDRAGMEEDGSGEIVIVTLDENGVPRALHRLHPGGPEFWEPVHLRGDGDPISIALSGEEGTFSDGLTDDRGHLVWAATRYLPEAGLALIVKVDEDEARAPLTQFRRQSLRLTLSLGALAILVGTILGFRFSKPIKDLAEVADRIRGGALSARAVEAGEDEVGLLSRTFNDMADEMEEQVSLLREFKRYFDLSRDMLCIAATDGYFKRVNPAFQKTLGWTTEELLSRSFLAFVHPDDFKKTENEIARLAKGLPVISFENRYRTKGGEYRHFMWTAHPDESSGLIYAIARDVTELERVWEEKEEESRYLRRRLREAEAKLRGTS